MNIHIMQRRHPIEIDSPHSPRCVLAVSIKAPSQLGLRPVKERIGGEKCYVYVGTDFDEARRECDEWTRVAWVEAAH